MSPILCQFCGQNPATIHFTELKDDQKRELHVCEACANAQGLAGNAPIPAILANLVQGVRRGGLAADTRCPACGITFAEFRTKARFGCPQDYEVFAEGIGPVLDKVQGARQHAGRLPRGRESMDTSVSDRLLRLRRDLQQAVEGEHYEQAADIRDEIRKLETAGDAGKKRSARSREKKDRGSV